MGTPFRRIDTIILRVAELDPAVSWYRTVLDAEPIYRNDDEGIAVLPVGTGTVTLWQRAANDAAAPAAGAAGTYPIFGVDDIEQAHAFVEQHADQVDPVQRGAGVRFFGFTDRDGNYLEACQVDEA